MKHATFVCLFLAMCFQAWAKSKPVVFQHKLGTLTFENRYEEEPINEPYRFFVTIDCKDEGVGGKKKHEVVTYWSNCGLTDFKWDDFDGKFTVTLKNNNEKNNYEGCVLEDKRELLMSEYCLPAKGK